jgi:hypothetical protein
MHVVRSVTQKTRDWVDPGEWVTAVVAMGVTVVVITVVATEN